LLYIKRIKSVWIWVVLIFLLALFLLSSSLGRKQLWSPAEQLIVEVIAPFQNLIMTTVRGTERLCMKYFHVVNTNEENSRLTDEIHALRIENSKYREMLTTHRRLQDLLQFKRNTNWPMLAAQVIGRDPSGWFRSAIINKGLEAGLKVNMPVVNSMGVVGRLVSVSRGYAKVLLVIDQNSAIDCINQVSRGKGILKGLSEKACELDYVLMTSEMSVGDMIITSGMGRIFPKGIPVGRITKVGDKPGAFFKEILVRPLVDFSKLEEVLVLLKEDPLKRNQTD